MKIDNLNDKEKRIYYVTKIAQLENDVYKDTYNTIMSCVSVAFTMFLYSVNPNNISASAGIICASIGIYCFGKELVDNLKLRNTEKEFEEINDGKTR